MPFAIWLFSWILAMLWHHVKFVGIFLGFLAICNLGFFSYFVPASSRFSWKFFPSFLWQFFLVNSRLLCSRIIYGFFWRFVSRFFWLFLWPGFITSSGCCCLCVVITSELNDLWKSNITVPWTNAHCNLGIFLADSGIFLALSRFFWRFFSPDFSGFFSASWICQ